MAIACAAVACIDVPAEVWNWRDINCKTTVVYICLCCCHMSSSSAFATVLL